MWSYVDSPECLLRASLLQVVFSVRSERLLMEQLQYSLLFRWKDGGDDESGDFRGQTRSNDTHASSTDPDARLMCKGAGREARLSYQAGVLMENRTGLLVGVDLRHATGTAEPDAALSLLDAEGERVGTTLVRRRSTTRRRLSSTCNIATSRRTSRATPTGGKLRPVLDECARTLAA